MNCKVEMQTIRSSKKASLMMIHNDYGAISGEEVEFSSISKLLKSQNHQVEVISRRSSELNSSLWGSMRGFFTGIYNPAMILSIRNQINFFKPDIVFIQNLYPIISPSILPSIRSKGIPIIMRVANYRLMCPNGLHFSNGEICERCLNGREWWCVFKNCEGRFFKSLGYAVRNWVARIRGLYQKNVDVYLCASSFLRQRMIDAGFEPSKLVIIPNIVEVPENCTFASDSKEAGYVGYVGRLSREKGIDLLLEISRMCPEIEFRLAGKESTDYSLPAILPTNVKMAGFIQSSAIEEFYRKARIIISTSKCFETFGMSIAEAMIRRKPVIVPGHGVFPGFVTNGETGLVADVGDSKTFVEAVRALWSSVELQAKLASAGQAWAIKMYSAESYYQKFSQVLTQLSSKPHNVIPDHVF